MEIVKLLDVCDVYQPQTIATKSFVPDEKYVVYGANGAIGKYNDYNHEESEVLMACRELRISLYDQIEKTVNEALAQSEAMRQSILKKAFEGRL